MRKSSIKTAFILGAGLGTRLRPLTDDYPKPLLPAGGRPMITYAMDHLISAGIERFIINTHYFAESYNKVFPDRQWRGIPMIFRYEPVLLDTAGGIKIYLLTTKRSSFTMVTPLRTCRLLIS
jgi:NDP-sugar pyrophosphorylase family protein